MRTQNIIKKSAGNTTAAPTRTSSYVIQWDWKEDAPIDKICKLSREYPYQYETTLGEDQNFLFFSTFPIRNDSAARALLGWD